MDESFVVLCVSDWSNVLPIGAVESVCALFISTGLATGAGVVVVDGALEMSVVAI